MAPGTFQEWNVSIHSYYFHWDSVANSFKYPFIDLSAWIYFISLRGSRTWWQHIMTIEVARRPFHQTRPPAGDSTQLDMPGLTPWGVVRKAGQIPKSHELVSVCTAEQQAQAPWTSSSCFIRGLAKMLNLIFFVACVGNQTLSATTKKLLAIGEVTASEVFPPNAGATVWEQLQLLCRVFNQKCPWTLALASESSTPSLTYWNN